MTDVTIIPFHKNYEQGVKDLIIGVQRDEFAIDITLDEQPDLSAIPKVYQQNNGNFWVALHNDRVVGTAGLIDIGSGDVALRKMFVDEKYRGSKFGVAYKLINEIFIWAKKQGINNIYLGTTEKFLAAHRFYEKHGFMEISKDQLPSAFPVMEVDKKFYCYSVNCGMHANPDSDKTDGLIKIVVEPSHDYDGGRSDAAMDISEYKNIRVFNALLNFCKAPDKLAIDEFVIDCAGESLGYLINARTECAKDDLFYLKFDPLILDDLHERALLELIPVLKDELKQEVYRCAADGLFSSQTVNECIVILETQ